MARHQGFALRTMRSDSQFKITHPPRVAQ